MRFKPLWMIIGVLLVLSPIGLISENTAWGEWSAEELEQMGLGFVPQGLAQLSTIWKAPVPDYRIPGIDVSVGYILSGVLGIALVVLASWLLGRLLSKDDAAGKNRGT